MRTFLWLTTVALVAAGLAVVAVADYADRHPDAALSKGLARMALAWTDVKASNPATPPCVPVEAPTADETVAPPSFIGFEPEVDDRLLRELRIISELGVVPELIPVDPIEVAADGHSATGFATEKEDEFEPQPRARDDARKQQVDSYLKQYAAHLKAGRYEEARTAAQAALELDPENARADAALFRANNLLHAQRDEQPQNEFTGNLKRIKQVPDDGLERVGVDFDLNIDIKPCPAKGERDCQACVVIEVLSGICQCMGEFARWLVGGDIEVEIAVCPDLPVPPPPPVNDVLMLMTTPRGLPHQCREAKPVLPAPGFIHLNATPPPGYVWLPLNIPLPNGQWSVGGFIPVGPGMDVEALQAKLITPQQRTAWMRPIPPARSAIQTYHQSEPWAVPVQPAVMQAQFVAPPRAAMPCPAACPPQIGSFTAAVPCPPSVMRCPSLRTDRGFAKEVSVDFEEQPLKEVLEQFRTMADINIVCDKPAFDAAGVAMDQPVTLKLDKVPCRVAIKHALNHCGLVCKVEDDVVVVTTRTAMTSSPCPQGDCPAVFTVRTPRPLQSYPVMPVQCPLAACPTSTPAVRLAHVPPVKAVAGCCEAPCIPPCAQGTCPRNCCEKECSDSTICAPRMKFATADGTVIEIQVIMKKASPGGDTGLKQASFETLEKVPAVVHPEDLPVGSHPDDLPHGEQAFDQGIPAVWEVIRSVLPR
jgi:hypothetical protein